VGETVQEPGAAVQLERGHDRGEGQQRGQLSFELGDFGGHVLSRQRPDDQLAVLIDPDRSLPASQDLLELTEGGVQLGVHAGQRLGREGRDADQRAELGALRRPRLRGDQVGGWVGVAARSRHVHIPAAQRVTQAQQHAQLPVVPVGGTVADGERVIEVAAPAGGRASGWARTRSGRLPGRCVPRWQSEG
jgi:hypothetical protein